MIHPVSDRRARPTATRGLALASAFLLACGGGTNPVDGGGDGGNGSDGGAFDAPADVAPDRSMVDSTAGDAGSPDGAVDVAVDARDAAADAVNDATGDAVSDAAGDAVDVAPVDADPCPTGTLCGGACLDTQTDVHHCGACDNDCTTLAEVDPAAVQCASGACVLTDACAQGFGDCDRDASNGCETSLTTPSNCNYCGATCWVPAHATATCNGTCSFACDPGYNLLSGVCYLPPRPIAPLSTSTVTSRRPTLRWAPTEAPVHVDLCADRACATVIGGFDSAGTSGSPAADLPHGTVFWRITGTVSGVPQPSLAGPVWQFNVGVRTAAISTSWGTTLDVNGDGYADMAVGAPTVGSGNGEVLVFNGGQFGITGANTFLMSPSTGARFGYSLTSAGDVNGDGYADLAISAPGASNGSGRVYVYYGGPSGLDNGPARTLSNNTPNGNFGRSLSSIGDVNGDGYADLAVGAPGVMNTVGEVDVFLGGPSGPGTAPSFTVASPGSAGENFGSSVAGVGDVNGDGYPDLAVGSPSSVFTPGSVYLYLGTASGLPTLPSTTLDAQDTGVQQFGNLSNALDANGDGYADLAVGAPVVGNGNGRTYLFYGSASGVHARADATLTPPDLVSTYDFGQGVARANDTNADGYDDLIVSAPSQGLAYLYLGGSAGIATTAAVTLSDTNNPGSYFGSAVAGVGDTNADGFADVAVGADEARSTDGSAFVYRGDTTGCSTTPNTSIGGPSSMAGHFGFAIAP